MAVKPITQQQVDDLADQKKTDKADIELRFNDTLKAFALVMLDEINLLRSELGQTPRTIEQLKTAVKSKL